MNIKSTERTYFSFDVFVNGSPVGYLDNFSDVQLPRSYTQTKLPLGSFSKLFEFDEGIKTICVYFPWSVTAAIEEISVDDGAFIEPVKPKKKMLVYGDSITHGYDALRPSMRYASRLADSLDAEEVNKAIGGDIFFPALAKLKDDFCPDYITVAYGTNDWNRLGKEDFKIRCKDFYMNLSKNYPDSKIFAITPIWRKDLNQERKFGAFTDVEKCIKDCVRDLKDITVISGFDFVPKDEQYFADLHLHPNDAGFDHYFNNLHLKIQSEV